MPVTFTSTEQLAPPARVTPESENVCAPTVAVRVPPQLRLLAPVATARPEESVSVKPIPVSVIDVAFGFVMVKISVSRLFSEVLPFKLSVCVIVGGPTTVRLAVDVLPVPPFVEVTSTLLFFTPAVVPVTFAETVQDAPGARDAPESETEDAPATAVAVPPHVLLKPLGVATTSPAGKPSVNATPLNVLLTFELLIEKLKLVVPFSGMLAAPNVFVMLGGSMTVRFADDVFPLPASDESIVTLFE